MVKIFNMTCSSTPDRAVPRVLSESRMQILYSNDILKRLHSWQKRRRPWSEGSRCNWMVLGECRKMGKARGCQADWGELQHFQSLTLAIWEQHERGKHYFMIYHNSLS